MSQEATLLLVVALAVLAGAALGTYMAWQPTTKSMQEFIEETKAEANKALQEVQKAAQDAGEGLKNIKVEVPPPKFSLTLSPWSAFWIFAATVLGIWAAQYRPKRIVKRFRQLQKRRRKAK